MPLAELRHHAREPGAPGLADDVADEQHPGHYRIALRLTIRGSAAALTGTSLAVDYRSALVDQAIEARGLLKRFGDREALRDVGFAAPPRRAARRDRAQRRRQDDAAVDPGRDPARPTPARSAGRPARSAGCRSRPGSTAGSPLAENLRLFARLEGVDDVEATVERMLEQTGLRRSPRRPGRRCSPAGIQQRVNIAIGLLSQPAVLLLDEPSAGLDPRQRERLWEFVLALAGGGTTVIFSTHNIQEAERYGEPPARARRRRDALRRHAGRASRRGPGVGRARLRGGVRRLPPRARPLMPGPADALAAAQGPPDPAALAAGDGAARHLPDRDRGADRVRALARAGEAAGRVPQRGARSRSSSTSAAAGGFDKASAREQLCSRVECVDVSSREEAEQKVADGDVLAALILPPDLIDKLESLTSLNPEQPTVEVLVNEDDPVKAQLVDDRIHSLITEANLLLSKQVSGQAANYLDLLVRGGTFDLLRPEPRDPRPRAVGRDPEGDPRGDSQEGPRRARPRDPLRDARAREPRPRAAAARRRLASRSRSTRRS